MDQAVHTEVVEESRQWVVYLLVIDADGVDRRRLSAHRTEREALVWASMVRRTAHRRHAPPSE